MRNAACCGRRAGASSAVAFGSGVLAVLVPKCPACVALWLSGLGLGAGVSTAVAPYLRTSALVLVAAALVVAAAYVVTASRRRHVSSS